MLFGEGKGKSIDEQHHKADLMSAELLREAEAEAIKKGKGKKRKQKSGVQGSGGAGEVVGPAIVPAPLDAPGSCLLYTSPSPRDQRGSRMPSSA